jgi:hypothetical protein
MDIPKEVLYSSDKEKKTYNNDGIQIQKLRE